MQSTHKSKFYPFYTFVCMQTGSFEPIKFLLVVGFVFELDEQGLEFV